MRYGAGRAFFSANEFILLLFQMDASLMLAVESILLQKSNKNLAAVTSLSAHCSPVSNKRHKLNISTASLASSCSSQVNNNYTTSLVDMDSLEDMLRKVWPTFSTFFFSFFFRSYFCCVHEMCFLLLSGKYAVMTEYLEYLFLTCFVLVSIELAE